jgi:hypothetical protein
MGSRFVHITAEWKLALEVMRTSGEGAMTVAVGVIFYKLSIENCKKAKIQRSMAPKPPIDTSYHHLASSL